MPPTKTTNSPVRRSDRTVVHIPSTVIPQGNGTILVLPGKPRIMPEEVTTGRFGALVNLSMSQVLRYCNEGLIKCRRLSPKQRSRYVIPITEVERFRNLHD